MGKSAPGLAALHQSVVLDPLNPNSHRALSQGLYIAHRYAEAVAAATETVSLDPESPPTYGYRGLAYYMLNDFEHARASCAEKPDYWLNQQCLAVTYEKLGRHADAQAMLQKLQTSNGDSAAYQYATIYAVWGDTAKALDWVETALRVHNPGLHLLKTDPLMDALRQEARFQKVIRELKFPN